MVRTAWVGVAFVSGIVVGVLGTRSMGDAPAAAGAVTDASAATVRGAADAPADPPAAPASASGSAPHVTRALAAPGESPEVQAAKATVQDPAAPPPGDGAASRRIEVGTSFHQLIDRPSAPGFPNEIGDAHRTLEQETRDDSWAYQMEAEIQNSLTAYVSTGELQVRFLECRSTLCEMRLFNSDAHPYVFNTWQEVMPSQPWMKRVQMVGMGMTSVKGGNEGLWIFRKAPQP